MAKRYSGKATVTVSYEDRGDYKASVAIGKRNVWRGRIGAPAAGFGRGIAYDSPKAYDSTAHAALSFADEDTDGEVGNAASSDLDGSGWHIGRSAATKWPKERNPAKRQRPVARGAILPVGWARAKGSAGFNVEDSPVYGAYVNRTALFAWENEHRPENSPARWTCVVTGLMSMSGRTLAEAAATGEAEAQSYHLPGEFDRRLTKAQFTKRMSDPRVLSPNPIANPSKRRPTRSASARKGARTRKANAKKRSRR